MLFNALATLVQTHRDEIASHAAGQLMKIEPYSVLGQQRIANGLTPWIDKMVEYLRDNDATTWRNYVSGYTQRELQRGYSMEFLSAIPEYISGCVINLIDANFATESQRSLRERYRHRISSFKNLSETAISNCQLQEAI
jgi:hypothetical protein